MRIKIMGKFYVLYLLLLFINCLLLYYGDAQDLSCLESDKIALLDFKMGINDPKNLLSSWRGNDCCLWRGIKCNNNTGAVISIDLHNPNVNLSGNGFTGAVPHSLGNISTLQYLDLSSNLLGVDNFHWVGNLYSLKNLVMNGVDLSMVNSDLFRELNRVPSLRELHLSDCGISGAISSIYPDNLTSLVVLDLSYNSFDSEFPDWIVNISSLVDVDLAGFGLYGEISPALSELPNLKYLSLKYNNKLTADCSEFFNGSWRKIETLNLDSNSLYGKIPASIGNISSLVDLNMYANQVEGEIPASIGNISSLVDLDMSNNEFEGEIPSSISNLCNLRSLILYDNNLTGGLPDLIKSCNSENGYLPSLKVLRLENNILTGKLPEWLGHLENLEQLDLTSNSIQGSIPASFGKLSVLTNLYLTRNKLTGNLPSTLGQLSNLIEFFVSDNYLSGVVSEFHFSKLTKLKSLHLSSNSLVLNVSSNWIPPFQVSDLRMGSCNLGPSFPTWLKTQKEVQYLDISNASISDEIPSWFWNLTSNIHELDVSHNQLQGQLPKNLLNFPQQVKMIYKGIYLSNPLLGPILNFSSNLLQGPIPIPSFEVRSLDLSNNQFSGPIPSNIGQLLPSLSFFSLSSNQLTGQIPASIGNMLFLRILDLSRNNLTGEVPLSLQNCSGIHAIDMRDNNLSGLIPELFGQLKKLETLHLENNRLSGNIPSSLRYCSDLEVLDLGNNRLSGNIPQWIGVSLSALKVLGLRSNSFSGKFPSQLTKLSSLQVLDLAENNLVGSIPDSIGNLKAMKNVRKTNQYWYRAVYYEESVTINTKGQTLTYTRILSLVTSIDLSGNDFHGDFPASITKLYGLSSLDLSRNHLTWKIPNEISKLGELSSLDLSMNQLSGGIPSSMSSMSSLGYLNLSNNNLSGSIPFLGQLATFDKSCYEGNLGLCGDPLPVKCERNDSGTGLEHEAGNDLYNNWFYLSVGLGYAFGLLVPIVVLVIKRPWCDAYFSFLDKIMKNHCHL